MRLGVKFSYLGKEYLGYQKQAKGDTVQGEIEFILGLFFDKQVSFHASSRTDSGVSAIYQIGHFDIDDKTLLDKIGTVNSKSLNSLVKRINMLMPYDIRFVKIFQVKDDFNSRYEAVGKTYMYNFYVSDVDIPYLSQFCYRLNMRDSIDGGMRVFEAEDELKKLKGEHDFSAFCAAGTSVTDKVRKIYEIELIYHEMGFFTLKVSGSGFLYNMVRIIAGTLFDYLLGRLKERDLSKILESKDRKMAGKTAPAVGLVLQTTHLDYVVR